MQTQTPSFIFCKLRQLFSNNVFTFSFLLITTLYLSADWFMDRYFMPKNISFVVGIILWGGICIGNWKRKIRLSVDFLFLSFRGSKLNCVIVLFFLLASKISFHIEFIFRYLSESKIMVYLID